MNRSFVVACIVAGTLAPALTSCTSVKVQSWTDPGAVGRAMGKTMVVGISNREGVRRDYEEQFAASLSEAGVEAMTSVSVLPSTEKIAEEEFLALLGDQNVDSVILTRVVGKEDRLRYNAPVDYPRPYYRHYGYYNYAYTRAYSPGYMTDYVETHLETNLYDVPTAKLVWSGQKSVSSETSATKNMRNVIKAVVSDLGKQGLLETEPLGGR